MPTRPLPLTICTLVRNRTAMLRELLRGAARSTVPPAEIVVVRAGGEDPRPALDAAGGLAVRVVDLPSDDDRIPYSAARNTAAELASTEAIVFLDADCIPSGSFVAAMGRALAAEDALCIGDVGYLPPLDHVPADEVALRALARPHPAREAAPASGWRRSDRHELAWGLCMAWRRSTFRDLGGFDTRYHGYAGEDTDLAVAARERGVPVLLVAGADVFHQHHDVYEPPLQQFRATLDNARAFRSKWGWWPMEGWLAAFADLGLVDWSPDAEHLVVRRDPSDDEIAAARHGSALPFRGAA